MKRETTLIRALVVSAGLAGAAVMASCDRGAELSTAVGQARNTLTALTGSGTSAAPAELRERKYAEVIKQLQEKLGTSDDPGQVSAANLLLAQATAGQAELIAARVRGADSALAAMIVQARGQLGLFREQRALAAARERYDPASQIAGFDDQARARTEEISRLTSDLAANEDKVKSFRGRAAAETAKANVQRNEERALLRGVEEMISVDRLDATKRAAGVRRAGDGFERAAAELEAEMHRYEPASDEIRREIRRAQSQKDSLAKSKQSLLDLQKFTREQVQDSLESAAQAEAKLSESVAALERVLAEDVKPKFEQAISKYGEASSKVTAARSGGTRQALAVTGGTIQHAVAGLQRERGQSLARLAMFMGELGAADPPLTDSATFTRSSAAILEESKQAITAAAEAYAGASGSFQGAGIEQYTRLAEQLSTTEKRLKGEPLEPTAESSAPGDGAAMEGGEITASEQPAAEPESQPAADAEPDPAAKPE